MITYLRSYIDVENYIPNLIPDRITSRTHGYLHLICSTSVFVAIGNKDGLQVSGLVNVCDRRPSEPIRQRAYS